jgi:hypothetical protein
MTKRGFVFMNSETGIRAGSGFIQPVTLDFIELKRGMSIGDAWCPRGSVIAVQRGKPAKIMPVDPLLYRDRAEKLIDQKLAVAHRGPATVELGRSIRPELEAKAAGDVRQATNPAPRRAETATGRPQRGAM